MKILISRKRGISDECKITTRVWQNTEEKETENRETTEEEAVGRAGAPDVQSREHPVRDSRTGSGDSLRRDRSSASNGSKEWFGKRDRREPRLAEDACAIS